MTILENTHRRFFLKPNLFSFLLVVLLISALPIKNNFVNATDHDEVTCGSVIKLTHVDTGTGKYLLYSEEKKLNTGSGQQLVTWVKNKQGSTKSLWWIRPRNHNDGDQEYHPSPEGDAPRESARNTCTRVGQPIQCGSVIRLTHMETGKNLHTHEIKSPLSRQQEVTAYGEGDGKGDNGDNWEVICDTKHWLRGRNFKLRHVDSKAYLGGSQQAEFNEQTCGRSCPLMHHLEAFGRKNDDQLSNLQVELGIHLYN